MLSTMSFIRATSMAILSCVLLSACNTYRVWVNETVVFSPDPLFTEFQVVDVALQDCITQHIEHANITSAAELTDLNCSQAGISSLRGIQAFHSLRALKLSHNQVRNLAPLAKLSVLAELYIDNNQIRDVSALEKIESLKIINLSMNPDIPCGDIPKRFRLKDSDLPKHCR
ncbi:MAG: Leucine-rich repeat (LRR) protein [Halieaceae bacterium]|jgi:Leucine-rich repeat (LRR) protein